MKIFRRLRLTQKELFGELRQQQAGHLGQVCRACMEATGNLSGYFYPKTDPVRPSLSSSPEPFQHLRRCPGALYLLPLRPHATPQWRPSAVPHLPKRLLATHLRRGTGGLKGPAACELKPDFAGGKPEL